MTLEQRILARLEAALQQRSRSLVPDEVGLATGGPLGATIRLSLADVARLAALEAEQV